EGGVVAWVRRGGGTGRRRGAGARSLTTRPPAPKIATTRGPATTASRTDPAVRDSFDEKALHRLLGVHLQPGGADQRLPRDPAQAAAPRLRRRRVGQLRPASLAGLASHEGEPPGAETADRRPRPGPVGHRRRSG